MFEKYKIKLVFESPIAGGVPTEYKAIKGKIAKELKSSNVIPVITFQGKTLDEVADILAKLNLKEVAKSKEGITAIRRDENGLFVKSYMVKAMIKDAFVNFVGKKWRDIINHCTRVEPEKIYLKRNGKIIKVPDGIATKLIHVVGAKGPRSAQVSYEYVEPPVEIEFEFYVGTDIKGNPIVKEDVLREVLERAGFFEGLGAMRPEGFGKFRIVEFEKIEPKKNKKKK